MENRLQRDQAAQQLRACAACNLLALHRQLTGDAKQEGKNDAGIS
jgi:hypothetical protein